MNNMKKIYSFILLLACFFLGMQQTKAAHVPVTNSSGYTLGNSITGGFNWNDKTETLSFTGIPDKLSFQYKYSSKNATQNNNLSHMYVEESADNSNWSTIWENSQPSTSNASSGNLQLQKSTRYIRFHYRGNFAGYYSSISVTELKYLEDPNPASIDFGSAAINAGEVNASVLVNWCNVATLSVTSSSDRFTVTPASFAAVDQYGSQQISVSYTHTNEVGDHNATVTISNGTDTKTFSVHAETTRRPQTIVWNEALAATGFAMNVGETYPDETIAAIATTANKGDVTFESDNTDVISVSADGKTLTALAAGTANIIASQAGDNEYLPAQDTKQFVVTNLLKQTITWEQNLLGLLTTSGNVTLTATASSGGDITYTSADDNVVTVSGNILTIVGEGETYVTATQAGGTIGGEEYLSISQQTLVIVRNPASQCNERALSVNSLTLNSSKLEQEYTMSGFPDTLTFIAKHGTKSGSFIGFNPVYSSLIVEQYACLNNLWDWYKVYDKVVGESNTASGNIILSETATKIRFRTTETGTDHTITSISVKRAKFLRSNIESVVEEAETNAIWQKEITVSHSNIDLLTLSVDAPFSLNTAILGEGCNDYGDDKFTVSFTPTEKNVTYTGTITITDSKANPSTLTIPVSVRSKGLNQAILGFTAPSTCLTTDVVTFNATASSELQVTYLSSDSTVAYVENGSLVILASGTVKITAYQAGNEKYDVASEEKTIVIEKTPVTVTAPEASDIHYGQTLSMSELTDGTSSVEGSFAWSTPDATPERGTHTFDVVFTPADAALYSSATIDVTVFVGKALPSVTAWPVAAALTFGDTLAMSALTGGEAAVEGAFAWADNTIKPSAGEQAYTVVFTPADDDNYDSVEQLVSVIVAKATPEVTMWPVASDIDYGQTLAASVLEGGVASVEGTFVWANDTVAPESGEVNAVVLFVPADTANIVVVEGTAAFYVRALQTIVWEDELTALVAGDSVQLNAVASSELAIVYSSSNAEVAYVDENGILHLVAAGEAVITASQEGSEHFVAAEPVEKSIVVVEPSDPTALENTTAETGKLIGIYTVTGQLIKTSAYVIDLPRGTYIMRYEHATRKVVVQ